MKPKRTYTPEEILQKATAYCAASEHCESEIIEKLSTWEVTAEEQCQYIQYLYEHHFLDSLRYCKSYVHDKFYFQRWGRKKIRMMLIGKGLPPMDIEQAMADINEEEYIALLRKILQTKRVHCNKGDSAQGQYKEKAKLIRFALSKGFEYDLIIQLLA